MTDKALIDEFCRWVDSGMGKVWIRFNGRWILQTVTWENTKQKYITDDKHQELRRLQIDKPDTKFEFKDFKGNWCNCLPAWGLDREYRVKVELVYEWQWYLQSDDGHYKLSKGFYIDDGQTAWTKLEESKRIKND